MLLYRTVLFVHLLALVAAATASGKIHIALARRAAATSAREALEWAGVAKRIAPVFPVAVILLLATGGYMVSDRTAAQWSWSDAWVQGGAIASVLLLVLGGILGARSAASGRALAGMVGAGRANDAPPPLPGAIACLSHANTGLALAAVFLMSVKPSSLVATGAALVVGAALGMLYGARTLATRPVEASEAKAAAA